MNCRQAQFLMALFITNDPDLTSQQCIDFQEHLEKCSRCAKEYEESRLAIELAKQYWPISEDTIAFIEKNSQSYKPKMTLEEGWKDLCKRCPDLGENTQKPGSLQLFHRIGTIAACLLIGFGLFFAMSQFKKTESNSPPIASNQQQNSVKIELISGSTTKTIPAGQLISTVDELKMLRINGNRQMVLDVGTQLSVEPYNLGCLVRLDKGKIYTEVEHDGKSFMIETSHGRAIITGTTFNIKADSMKMDLAVIEGSVQFESENGVVTVRGGYQSSIIAGMKPTKPVACNVTTVSQWARKQKTNGIIQVNQSDSRFYEMLDLPVSVISYRDLENIDFGIWIRQHRSWFEREFPWSKRLQKILSKNAIQMDTIDLLVESGDLWRFAWPENSWTQILSENFQVIETIATKYGIEIDRLLPTKSTQSMQDKMSSGMEGLQRWLDAFDKRKEDLTIDSIHAAIFLANTRSLAWFAIQNGKIQTQDKQQVLDLLVEQVRTASNSLETLNQLLLADKNNSDCSVAQYDELIKKFTNNIASIKEIERNLAKYEIVGK